MGAFYTCVVSNTITSLFLESTMAFAEHDTQQVIQDRLDRKDEYVKKLRDWFNNIDDCGLGSITYDQFAKHANDPSVHAFAEALDIELLDLEQFFSVLSDKGRRPVNLENFVIGCIKMKGSAKSMDLMDLIHFQKAFAEDYRKRLIELQVYCRQEFEEIKNCLEPERDTGMDMNMTMA